MNASSEVSKKRTLINTDLHGFGFYQCSCFGLRLQVAGPIGRRSAQACVLLWPISKERAA